MPRRIYTYEPGRGWDIWNLIVTIGAFVQAVGILVFVVNLMWSLFRRANRRQRSVGCVDARVGDDFAAARIQFRHDSRGHSRRPLWDLKHPEDPDWKYE